LRAVHVSRTRVLTLAAVVVLLVGAISVTIAVTDAKPAQAAVWHQDWVQTPGNSAGAEFHSYGDYFWLWDNKCDGRDPVVNWFYSADGGTTFPDVFQVIYRGSCHHNGKVGSGGMIENKTILFNICERDHSGIEHNCSGYVSYGTSEPN
jgi:hypothetical protein